jgi:uncharacterized protein (DUF58 family)
MSRAVIPSGLLIGLLLAAVPLIALGGTVPMLPSIGVGVMIGVMLLAVVDGLVSRARDEIEVTRQVEEILSLGAENRVEVTLRNRTGRPLRLKVKDDPPAAFRTPDRLREITLDPWESRTVAYVTTPQRRGDYEFGDLHVRARSRLRLAWWQKTVPAEEAVRVYPNLRQIREFDALARRGRLEDVGLRVARARGEGTEFESLREYVPDDSFRHIDWKATARRNVPITRQYQTERNQTLILLIDAGRMMAAPVDAAGAQMARVDYAINSALMLAHVAERMGDTVGLLVFSDRVKTFVPPARGGAQAERMLEELYALEAELVEPDFRAAISFLRARARKRAMVCAFTDLVDPEVSARALSYLSSLRPQHLPLVATIRDAEVEALADADPEAAGEAYAKAIAARTLGQRELALARLRASGALVCDAPPGELAAAVVERYLSVKRRGLL